MMPVIPTALANAVEIAYPIPEEITVGTLFCGGNVVGLVFTYVGQILLAMDAKDYATDDDNATTTSAASGSDDPVGGEDLSGSTLALKLSSYGLFSMFSLFIGLVSVLLYHSRYERLYVDVPRDEEQARRGEGAAGGGR
jgi:hypothetical protein